MSNTVYAVARFTDNWATSIGSGSGGLVNLSYVKLAPDDTVLTASGANVNVSVHYGDSAADVRREIETAIRAQESDPSLTVVLLPAGKV